MAWDVSGRDIIFMLAESFGYLAILLLSESSYFQNLLHWIDKKRTPGSMEPVGNFENQISTIDEDVELENIRIRKSNPSDFALMLKNISKIYPPTVFGGDAKYAVKQLSLGCAPSERFGLLGINGAVTVYILDQINCASNKFLLFCIGEIDHFRNSNRRYTTDPRRCFH